MRKLNMHQIFSDRMRTELSKVIVGQHHMIDSLLIGLLCNGHVLLEGVPGLAKTLTIKSLAQAVSCQIQPYTIYTRSFTRRCYRDNDL